MQQNSTRVWRALLQLAQATHAVLEREVPERAGLPAGGLAVLQLLRWHGGKTLRAIAAHLDVTPSTIDELLREMVRLGFTRRHAGSNGTDADVFELAPGGVAAARRIVAAQRERVGRSISHLPSDQREAAAALLETLAYELVTASPEFRITCAECWAFDAQECTKPSCAFRKARRVDLNPDLGEGPDDCPSSCVTRAIDILN